MPNQYTLAWTPGVGATNQTVQYRVRDTGPWTTISGITPTNPLSGSANSAVVTGLDENAVYQFQVLSNCCPGVVRASIIRENVIFNAVTVDTTVDTGVISVNTNTLATVDTIDYKLYDGGDSLVEAIQATGLAPSGEFLPVLPGSYSIKYRFTSTVNDVDIHSDDVGQAGAYFATPTVIVT